MNASFINDISYVQGDWFPFPVFMRQCICILLVDVNFAYVLTVRIFTLTNYSSCYQDFTSFILQILQAHH